MRRVLEKEEMAVEMSQPWETRASFCSWEVMRVHLEGEVGEPWVQE